MSGSAERPAPGPRPCLRCGEDRDLVARAARSPLCSACGLETDRLAWRLTDGG